MISIFDINETGKLLEDIQVTRCFYLSLYYYPRSSKELVTACFNFMISSFGDNRKCELKGPSDDYTKSLKDNNFSICS